jgi:hypothetical protein
MPPGCLFVLVIICVDYVWLSSNCITTPISMPVLGFVALSSFELHLWHNQSSPVDRHDLCYLAVLPLILCFAGTAGILLHHARTAQDARILIMQRCPIKQTDRD